MGSHLNQGVATLLTVILFFALSGCEDNAPWVTDVTVDGESIALPFHEITRRDQPTVLSFQISAEPYRDLEKPTLYLTRAGSNANVFLDDTWVFGESFDDRPMAHTWNTPYLIPLPKETLRNATAIRIETFAFPGDHLLLEPFQVGEYSSLSSRFRWQRIVQIDVTYGVTIAALVLSILLLLLWASSRASGTSSTYPTEREILLAGLTSISFAAANLNFHVVHQPVSHGLWTAFAHIALDWYCVVAAMWLLENKGVTNRFARLLWIWPTITTVINIGVPATHAVPLVEILHIVSFATFFGAFVIPSGVRKWTGIDRVIFIGGGVFGSGFGFVDLLMQFNVINAHGMPRFTPIGFFVLLVSANILLLRRFIETFRAARRSNEQLASMVRDAEAELETQHDRLRRLEAKQARIDERQNVLREIHDGMGGHLVSALTLSESSSADQDVPNALRSALDEMRLLIDATGTESADLGVALGSVRQRIEPVVTRAGLELVWAIDPFGKMPELSAANRMHIVRILQESITNTIKHANASTITVQTEPLKDEEIQISIKDDGDGFTESASSGRGLKNMRYRAEKMGCKISFDSLEGAGTTVTLLVPFAGVG